MIRRVVLSLVLALAWAASALARSAGIPGDPSGSTPRFDLPIRCTLGEDCFIQNYFDRDPGSGWRDYACGFLSYDGHHGTDFRVLSLARMERGVDVLAAAPGRVVAVRDGQPDIALRDQAPGSVAGREAGNAVRIAHGEGWETQYSHLRRGSVRVRPGQRVRTGDVLGLVGLSGKTDFPHVDFVVRRNGRAIDPFDPPPEGADAAPSPSTCGTGPGEASVWRPEIAVALRYVPTGVLVAGFAPEPVEQRRAQREEHAGPIDASAGALVFFIESFGLRVGDRERIEIEAPDGRVLASAERTVERNQAVRFAYVGKRRSGERWSAGTYTGRYRVERGDTVAVSLRRDLVIR